MRLSPGQLLHIQCGDTYGVRSRNLPYLKDANGIFISLQIRHQSWWGLKYDVERTSPEASLPISQISLWGKDIRYCGNELHLTLAKADSTTLENEMFPCS